MVLSALSPLVSKACADDIDAQYQVCLNTYQAELDTSDFKKKLDKAKLDLPYFKQSVEEYKKEKQMLLDGQTYLGMKVGSNDLEFFIILVKLIGHSANKINLAISTLLPNIPLAKGISLTQCSLTKIIARAKDNFSSPLSVDQILTVCTAEVGNVHTAVVSTTFESFIVLNEVGELIDMNRKTKISIEEAAERWNDLVEKAEDAITEIEKTTGLYKQAIAEIKDHCEREKESYQKPKVDIPNDSFTVNSQNQAAFSISGSSVAGANIVINIKGTTSSWQTDADDKGKWSAVVNLTKVADGGIEIIVKNESGRQIPTTIKGVKDTIAPATPYWSIE